MKVVLAIIFAYFIGSIPSGLIIGRIFRGVDIRKYGSGNLGATNAFRVLGPKLGTAVLFIDILKGLAPVILLPPMLALAPASAGLELMIGASAIIGHVFSCFVSFRGGKGVATALGAFLAIAVWETLLLLVIGLAIIAITGYVSLAAVVGATLLPIFLLWFGKPFLVLLAGEVIALVIVWRHRANIVRLLEGTELKVWQRDKWKQHDEQPIPLATATTSPRSPRPE